MIQIRMLHVWIINLMRFAIVSNVMSLENQSFPYFTDNLFTLTTNHYSSHSIPKERSIITPLPLRNLLTLSILLRQLSRRHLPPLILPPQVKRHERAEHQTHRLEPDQNRMSGGELRCICGAVDVGGNNTTDVTEGDVHGHSDAALGRAADVVAVPRDALRDVGIDAAGDEEDADVFDGVVLGRDEHYEAD